MKFLVNEMKEGQKEDESKRNESEPGMGIV